MMVCLVFFSFTVVFVKQTFISDNFMFADKKNDDLFPSSFITSSLHCFIDHTMSATNRNDISFYQVGLNTLKILEKCFIKCLQNYCLETFCDVKKIVV